MEEGKEAYGTRLKHVSLIVPGRHPLRVVKYHVMIAVPMIKVVITFSTLNLRVSSHIASL